MTEPSDFTPSLNSYEVFTFDSATKRLKKSHIFNSLDQKHNFPKLFVCKIYSDICSVGTGFIFRAPSGRPLIITALHVRKNIFYTPSQYFVCFKHDQSDQNYITQFNKLERGGHVCISGIYKIIPTNLTPFFSLYKKDPETNQVYAMDNDITAFYLLNECICGQQKDLPNFDYVEVGSVPPVNTKCYLFGFPGSQISIEQIIPHAPEYENMLRTEKRNLLSEALLWTKGKVVSIGSLVAIDAPSLSGFSGGPVLYNDGGTWKIFSILLGGPAIQGHLELLELYGLCSQRNMIRVEEKIEALGNIFPNDVFHDLKIHLQHFLINRPDKLLNACKESFYELVFLYCQSKQINRPLTVSMLNHNLTIKVQDFVKGLWI